MDTVEARKLIDEVQALGAAKNWDMLDKLLELINRVESITEKEIAALKSRLAAYEARIDAIKFQSHELLGVLSDIDNGKEFDRDCYNTLERVIQVLRHKDSTEHLDSLLQQAREEERERCAKVCESIFDTQDDSCDEAERCAAAIRKGDKL